MHKTLLLTDLHLTDEAETIIGLDPFDRLQRVLDHALTHHPDAARLVLLGDLTHHGTHSEYMRLKPVIDACPVPITLTVGNHDIRAVMADVLGADRLTKGFAQHAWRAGETLFLLLDSLDEDGQAPTHGGWLCEQRLTWVADQIATRRPKQIVAMMHHPPFDTGFPGMDRIRLMNGDALLTLLEQTQIPTHLICGHVHRTISGMTRGFPFSVLKSSCHQMPMNLADDNSGLSVDEPGAYGILLTNNATVIVHTEDVFETKRDVAVDAGSE